MFSSRGIGPAERELGHKAGPSTRWALQLQPPLQRFDPVGQAAPTPTTRRVWAANTVVGDLHGHQARPAPDPDPNPHQLPTEAAALGPELADSPNRKATRSQLTFHGVEPL